MKINEITVVMIYQSEIPDLQIIRSDTNGYAITRNGRTLLIDCPQTGMHFDKHHFNPPEVILHTHVQKEHCMEWQSFPDTEVYVPAGTADIARRADRFFKDCSTVWPEDRSWDTRGNEKYGVAGAVTERPPEKPLHVKGELKPGRKFTWQDIELEIIVLPGHGKRSIGLYWKKHNVLFSGDLIRLSLIHISEPTRPY